jgi:acid phosphatase type 7
MRSRNALAACLLAAAACGDSGAGPDATAGPVLDGGRLTPPGCDHEVVTRRDAEAPVLGGDEVGADPAPFHVRLGLGGDPTTSMAILWRTDEATTVTEVRYGTGGALDREATGLTFRYASGVSGVGDLIRIHEAHLCGLTPDTEYSYQVGGGGAWSPTYTFRTAPDAVADPDAEVTVAYVGDSRGGYDVWRRVAGVIAERAPDLLVFTGDVVTLGFDQEEWDAFFAAGEELLARVPMVAAHGNHEVNAVHYFAQLAMPGDEENFGLTFGHLHQVVLNSDPPSIGSLTGAIPAFLDAELTASSARWSIVTMHRSLWSSSTRHGSDTTLRNAWGPILDAHQVDVVISGHDHVFERSKPIRGEVIGETPADGTIYLVSGGAGATLYGLVDPRPEHSAFAESTHNATLIRIRRDLLDSESFRDDGSPLDQFTIDKP